MLIRNIRRALYSRMCKTNTNNGPQGLSMYRVKRDGPGVDVLVDLLIPLIWRPEIVQTSGSYFDYLVH